jgi:hypothetical protein
MPFSTFAGKGLLVQHLVDAAQDVVRADRDHEALDALQAGG